MILSHFFTYLFTGVFGKQED